ncbi:MAG: putative metalloprotease CJM1_0395 family protein [Planctomycetota bacterium]
MRVDSTANPIAAAPAPGVGRPAATRRAEEAAPIERGSEARSPGGQRLDDSQQREVRELESTDQRVRRHEEAHRAAAGPLFRGGPFYKFRTGPDGKKYAVAGSVKIDTSPARTPEETVQKAAQIRRAALAPADPSSTDRAIAAKAARMESAARQAMVQEQLEQATEGRRAQADRDVPDSIRAADDDGTEATLTAPDAGDGGLAIVERGLTPGDLGAEVWASQSDLRSPAERLDELRRSGGVDVLA